MLDSARVVIDELLIEKKVLKKQQQKVNSNFTELNNDLSVSTDAREIIQKAAILTQSKLASHISSIVSKALSVVFPEKDLEFLVEFIQRRNTTEADLWLLNDDEKYEILESRGHGIADIISLSLRVAYVLLHTNDNIILLDEPGRNISKDKHEAVAKMIKMLSYELNVQFIIVTHSETFTEYADFLYKVSQKNKISTIKQIK